MPMDPKGLREPRTGPFHGGKAPAGRAAAPAQHVCSSPGISSFRMALQIIGQLRADLSCAHTKSWGQSPNNEGVMTILVSDTFEPNLGLRARQPAGGWKTSMPCVFTLIYSYVRAPSCPPRLRKVEIRRRKPLL